jgi:hypothetical protein
LCGRSNSAAESTVAGFESDLEPSNAQKALGLLYVDDGVNEAVDILRNGSWRKVGSITSGVGDIVRNWVEAKGNLYERVLKRSCHAAPPERTHLSVKCTTPLSVLGT